MIFGMHGLCCSLYSDPNSGTSGRIGLRDLRSAANHSRSTEMKKQKIILQGNLNLEKE